MQTFHMRTCPEQDIAIKKNCHVKKACRSPYMIIWVRNKVIYKVISFNYRKLITIIILDQNFLCNEALLFHSIFSNFYLQVKTQLR